jgi:hypothetical protein
MTPLEYSLHSLAENLGMTVADIHNRMTWNELQRWFAYYAEQNRKQEAANGNLMAMDSPDQMLSAFGVSNG